MNTDLRLMHETVMAEVRSKAEPLRRELKQLHAVYAYHRDALKKIPITEKTKKTAFSEADVRDPLIAVGVAFDENISQPEACRRALKELGGEAETPKIIAWLTDKGLGKNVSDKVFGAMIYNALTRRKDIFKKVGRGRWKLQPGA
jgi:hypothetical protein